MKITQIKIFNGTDWINYTLSTVESILDEISDINQELLRLDAADTANINFISSEISGINSEISGINQELPTKLSKPQIAVEKKQLVAINTNNEQEFVSEDNYMKYNDLLQYLSGIIKVQFGDMPLGTKFQNLSESHSIVISDGVTEIPYDAFKGCNKVNNIFIADSIKELGGVYSSSSSTYSGAFSSTAFYKNQDNWTNNMLYINNCFVKATQWAFNNQTITIKNGTTCIGGAAFAASQASSIVLDQALTLKSISANGLAFLDCFTLTIPDSVTYIGSNGLSASSKLKTISMGSGITSIPSGCFRYDTALEVVDFTKATQVPTLTSTNIFDGIATDFKIKVPSSLYNEWIVATNWSAFASKTVSVDVNTEA